MESLTIGPLTRKTDYAFWHKAFHDFPTGPRLKRLNEVTIIYRYPHAGMFAIGSQDYFDAFLSRMDIFPRSMRVDIRIGTASYPHLLIALKKRLSSLRRCRVVTFNSDGECGLSWTVSFLLSHHLTPGLH